MIVTVSLDLPKRRSARILTSPRVTVSPRNRLPHRARNGTLTALEGGEPHAASWTDCRPTPYLVRAWSRAYDLVGVAGFEPAASPTEAKYWRNCQRCSTLDLGQTIRGCPLASTVVGGDCY
jgi:hypothetical protein